MRIAMTMAGALALSAMVAGCGGQTDQADQPSGEQAAAPEPQPETTPSGPKPPAAFAQCRACHAVEPGRHGVGPSLAGIYGTKAGELPGYAFSDAMKKSGLTWDDATLDAWLRSPAKLVPGTKMVFFGMPDPEKRKQVIDYIKAIK